MEAERTRLQQGMVQVYTGNGKGKSTAAFGLALRAAGCNMHVVIIQFMKVSGHYAEDEGIRRLGETVEHYCFGNPGSLAFSTTVNDGVCNSLTAGFS